MHVRSSGLAAVLSQARSTTVSASGEETLYFFRGAESEKHFYFSTQPGIAYGPRRTGARLRQIEGRLVVHQRLGNLLRKRVHLAAYAAVSRATGRLLRRPSRRMTGVRRSVSDMSREERRCRRSPHRRFLVISHLCVDMMKAGRLGSGEEGASSKVGAGPRASGRRCWG